jgi:YidC/Oxa1 family membrane protein insertase
MDSGRRLFLALFLSAAVLMVYTMLNPPQEKPRTPSEDATSAALEPAAAEGPAEAVPEQPKRGAVVTADAEEEITLDLGTRGEPGSYRAVFRNRGAVLSELRLGSYFVEGGISEEGRADPANWTPLVLAANSPDGGGTFALAANASSRELVGAVPLEEALWEHRVLTDADGAPLGVEFRYAPGTGATFVKRITAVPDTYRLDVELTIENAFEDFAGPRQFLLTPAAFMPVEIGDRFYPEPNAVAAGPLAPGVEPELEFETRRDSGGERTGTLDVEGPLAFAGSHNKYFAMLLRGRDEAAVQTLRSARYVRRADLDWAAAEGVQPYEAMRFVDAVIDLKLVIPPAGEAATWSYTVFAGPKRRSTFLSDFVLEDGSRPHELVLSNDIGWFSSIGNLLLFFMGLLYKAVGNWGVAIILLTFCIRLVLFPMNRRSQTAMARYQKKMKRVQPKLNDIKERYKDDPQKLRQEQARIMQEEKAFPPLGGCLPMFLQLPIFFGLFGALRTSFDLRQAAFFGPITDLSLPDRLLRIDLSIPLGFTTLEVTYLNVLPILMIITWVLQQKMMPKPADEQAQRMQRMMMFMPVVMGVFLYNYASGLSLYMITQSTLGIIEQGFIKRRWPVNDDEPEKEKPGCGPFSGMMQNLAEKQREQQKRLEQMKKQGKGRPGGQGKRKKAKR